MINIDTVMAKEIEQERRLYPRYSVDFFVQLTIAAPNSEAEYRAAAINLSQNGIQLSCSSEIVSALLEQIQYPPTCRLSFPIPGTQYQFNSHCRLVANRRISQDDYRLGFMFISFLEQSEQRLIDYLTACHLEPS